MGVGGYSKTRGMTTPRGGSVVHFLRVLRYARAYRRYLYPAIACIVMVALTYSINIAALLPIIEGIQGDDGLPTWIREFIVEKRLGLELTVEKRRDATHVEATRVLGFKGDSALEGKVKIGDHIIGIDGKRLKRPALFDRLAAWPPDQPMVLMIAAETDVWKPVSVTPRRVGGALRVARRVAGWLPVETTPDAKLRTLAVIVIAVLVVAMIGAVCRFGGEYLIALVAARTVIGIRRQMYRRVLRTPISHFSQHGTSDTISRFVQDSQDIYRGLNFVFAKTVREPLKALFTFAFALYLDPRITLVTIIVAPFAAYLIRRLGKLIRKANKRMLEGYGRMLGTLEGALSGIRVVKGYGMESYERRHLFAVDQQILKQQLRIARIEAMSSPIFETIGRIVATLAILYFADQMFNDHMDFSKFVALAATMAAIFDPVRKMSNMYNRIQRANAAAERVFEILDGPQEESEQPSRPALPLLDQAIEFRNVRFTYPGADAPALDGITLSIQRGERIALVGPNGSGKTTLLSMLMRFFEPDEGQVCFDGRDVRSFSISSLRGQMSLVTQDTVVFADTIANNIAYGDDGLLRRMVLQQRHPERRYVSDADRQRIEDAARAAFADEFIRQKPNGYDTPIGQHGATLSGGQKQRIAIARAFLRNAPIFIFDEATSQVDTESEQKIHDAVERFLEGRTAFIIAHRFSTITQADRIAVMDKGRIIDVGSHRELVGRCPLYQSLFGAAREHDGPAGVE